MSEIDVLIEGKLIGRVRMNKAGRLSFDYEPRWRDSPGGYSLSASMPLASITYSHNLVSPYLWNLLPENPNVLQRWGNNFTSPRRVRSIQLADFAHRIYRMASARIRLRREPRNTHESVTPPRRQAARGQRRRSRKVAS
jgi:HipA-like protein